MIISDKIQLTGLIIYCCCGFPKHFISQVGMKSLPTTPCSSRNNGAINMAGVIIQSYGFPVTVFTSWATKNLACILSNSLGGISTDTLEQSL